LADEMLRGTNSRDKLEGSKAIVRKILEYRSYAIVATHDIGLTKSGMYDSDELRNFFFDIDYADGELLFDYKIKEGVCESFNASFLLNQLGIDVSNNYSKEI
jgi:DNA mismatch repair ATPase MutS